MFMSEDKTYPKALIKRVSAPEIPCTVELSDSWKIVGRRWRAEIIASNRFPCFRDLFRHAHDALANYRTGFVANNFAET